MHIGFYCNDKNEDDENTYIEIKYPVKPDYMGEDFYKLSMAHREWYRKHGSY